MKKVLISLLFSTPAFALEPLVDSELSRIDGQSGITIETELMGQSTIGQIAYTDNDGDGLNHENSAGIYLSDISMDSTSMTMKIDVTSDGALNISITDITQGDIWIRDIAMGDAETSFGAVGLTDFVYDENGSYNIRFSPFDTGDGLNRAAIIFNLNMASSSFTTTFIDEAKFNSETGIAESGNTISYRTQFENFRAEDTAIYADDSVSDDGSEWLRMDIGSITGSAELQNISFGSIGNANAAQVLGTAGFSGINIENSSFIAISAH